jgi:hypothetical protein
VPAGYVAGLLWAAAEVVIEPNLWPHFARILRFVPRTLVELVVHS